MPFITLISLAGISGLVHRSIYYIIVRSIDGRTVAVHSKDLIPVRTLRRLRCYYWPRTITWYDASTFFMNVTSRDARKPYAFMQDGLGWWGCRYLSHLGGLQVNI